MASTFDEEGDIPPPDVLPTDAPPAGAMRGRELIDRAVIASGSGERLGEVSAIIIDRDSLRIVALRVRGRLFTRERTLPFASVTAIGSDAVMIPSKESLDDGVEIPNADDGLPGRSVISEGGNRLGEVEGFEFDTKSGEVIALRLRHDRAGVDERERIPRAEVVRLGPDAVVVRG